MNPLETSLAIQIREAFPPVSRPPDTELTVHGDECVHCSSLRDEFKDERGGIFSPDRARWLLGELSMLSPSGFQWILPSYLAAIFADDANLDLGEFLAYHFGGTCREDEEAERDARVAVLSRTQIDCLIEVLLWIRAELGSVYSESVDEAISFLSNRINRIAEQAGTGSNPGSWCQTSTFEQSP